jgi:hypothetical protein
MVSNLLKRWWDDFATVKRQKDGFGASRKETGCHPASSHPTSSTVYTRCAFKKGELERFVKICDFIHFST